MKTFAVIENGVVINVIVGVPDDVVEANSGLYVEYTEDKPAGIGWLYDGKKFIIPTIETA